MAPRLPDAGRFDSFMPPAGREISRFPSKERPHMPGSQTTPGRPGARADAPVHVAFRVRYRVGTRDEKSFAAPYLAYALPYRRFANALTGADARLGADVVRYSFIAVDSHHLLLAGLPGAHRTIPHAWAFCPYTLVIVASNHAAHSTVFKKLSFDP